MTVPVVKHKTASPVAKAAERKRKRKGAMTGADNQAEPESPKTGDGKSKKKTTSSKAVSTKPRAKGQKSDSDRKVDVAKEKRIGARKSGKPNAKEEIEVDEEQGQTASEAEEDDEDTEDDEDDQDSAEQDDEDEDEEEEPPVRSARELAKGLGKSHTYEKMADIKLAKMSRDRLPVDVDKLMGRPTDDEAERYREAARDPTDEEWVKIFKNRSLLKGFDAAVFSGNKIGHATLAAFKSPKTVDFDKPGGIGIEHTTNNSKQQEDMMIQGLVKKEIEAKAEGIINKFTVGGGIKAGSTTETSQISSTQKSYRSTMTYHNFPFVMLNLNQSNLELTDACREAVDRFLKTPSYTLATTFISAFGLFYATEVTLGGRLWNTHQVANRDEEKIATQTNKSNASLEVNGSVPLVASGSVSIGVEAQNRSQQGSASYEDEMETRLKAIGGAAFAATDPSRWLASLCDPMTWACIEMGQIAGLPAVISSFAGYGSFERTLLETIEKGEPAAIPIPIRPYVPATRSSHREFFQEPLLEVRLGSGVVIESGTVLPPSVAVEELETVSADRVKWTLIHNKATWTEYVNTFLSAEQHHNVNLEFIPQYLTKFRYGDLEIPQATLVLEYLAKPRRAALRVNGSAETQIILDAIAAKDIEVYQAKHGDHYVESRERAVIATALWVIPFDTSESKKEAVDAFLAKPPRNYPNKPADARIINGEAIGLQSTGGLLQNAWPFVNDLLRASISTDGWLYSSNSTAQTLNATGPYDDKNLRAELSAHIASEAYITSCIWVKPLPVGGVVPQPASGRRKEFWVEPLRRLLQTYPDVCAYGTNRNSISAGSGFLVELDQALEKFFARQKNILKNQEDGCAIVAAATESQALTKDLDPFKRSDTKRRCKQYWLDEARKHAKHWYDTHSYFTRHGQWGRYRGQNEHLEIGAPTFPQDVPQWLLELPFFVEVQAELLRQVEHRRDSIAMEWKWDSGEHSKVVDSPPGKTLLALDIWNGWSENEWSLDTQPLPGHDKVSVRCFREDKTGCDIAISSYWI